MKFQILTLFPEFFHSCLQVGLLHKAVQNSLITVELVDIKTFSKKGRADDYPFGGGSSMLLAYPPLQKALQSVKKPGHVVCLSPQGERWTAQKAKSFSKKYKTLTLICGRYGGLDARFVQDFVDEEISIGDYILNGGELASLVLIESCSRFLEAFMGNKKSHQKDSFEDSLLSAPHWTKPREIKGHKIPEVVLSGHHKKIEELRFYTSLILTWLKRPDLLKGKSELLDQIPQAQKRLQQLSKEELKALGLSRKNGGLLTLFRKS